jgi:hypothetical protein
LTIIGIEDRRLGATIVAVHALPGLRAGSALLRIGEQLCAVQDDAWRVALIQLPELSLRHQILAKDGAALGKAIKPDFEAAFEATDGIVNILGSGSNEHRCSWVQLDLVKGHVRTNDIRSQYDVIRHALNLQVPLNIEAAVLDADLLHLYHRGVGGSLSASISLQYSHLNRPAPRLGRPRYYRLGEIDGIPLHITDAARLRNGQIAILAAAEDTGNALTDGPVVGSVFGVLDHRQDPPSARWTRLLDTDGAPTQRKAEGLALDDDGRSAWVLTDPDSSSVPAELCRVELNGLQGR